MDKLLIIDGNSMLFRAYYAAVYGKKMTSSDGTPTNAIFGFASMLAKAIEIVRPNAFFVAFDAGKHTFRHEIYKDYKGNRSPAPDDLVPQFQMVRDFLDAFAIPWREMKDIEADDLIGTVSKKFNLEGQSYILTSDHDMLQLVDSLTSVLMMKKGLSDIEEMTPEKIQEEYGIPPIQIIDMKGLMGDTSDNYPGIPGVGQKTAIKLLKQFGSFDGVIEHHTEIKGALGKKVAENLEQAKISKKLAEIRRDISIDISEKDLVFTPDYEGAIRYLQSLDMKKIAERYHNLEELLTEKEHGEDKSESDFSFVTLVPKEMLKEPLFIYVDDDPGHFFNSKIHGMAFSDGKKAVYILLADILKDEDLLNYLKSEEPFKTGYDIKRSNHLLEKEHITVCWHEDVMIMASLADSTLTSTDKIQEAMGKTSLLTYADVYGKPNHPIVDVDCKIQLQHACSWADFIFKLYKTYSPKIAEFHMESLYRNIEMPLTFILEKMETEGIRCDSTVLNEISERIKAQMDEESKSIYQCAGKEFNINSPKQLAEVLYDDLGLYGGKKRSTSADTLSKLVDYHPIIGHIMNYRKLAKIYSTYSDGLQKYIQEDNKIHTVYNQCSTQTGRLSSSEPNLQNISVRDEQGREIRKAFLPEDGCVLISSDYHQVELRILAYMADENALIQTFIDGVDVHTRTAMDVFGKSADEVTPEDRRRAKAVNFGIVYGISDFGLAEQIGSTRKEAGEFIEKYYTAYPGIRSYMDSIVKFCEENGYVVTLCGRRREIPEIHAKAYMQREFGKRAAMNAPIQGTAADLIKIAMIRIAEKMEQEHVKSKMILQVHDELIFNVPLEEIDLMKEIITDGMTHAMELKVPLTTECSVGKTWYEAK